MITFDDFKKMEIRIGTILKVEPVPETDKPLCCQVDFGLMIVENPDGTKEEKRNIRQIISGIHEFYPDPNVLINKQVLYIVNLEPRIIKGYESNGMLMAVDGIGGKPVFLVPEVPVNPGSKVR